MSTESCPPLLQDCLDALHEGEPSISTSAVAHRLGRSNRSEVAGALEQLADLGLVTVSLAGWRLSAVECAA